MRLRKVEREIDREIERAERYTVDENRSYF